MMNSAITIRNTIRIGVVVGKTSMVVSGRGIVIEKQFKPGQSQKKGRMARLDRV